MKWNILSKYLSIIVLGLPILVISLIVFNIFKAVFLDLMPNTEFSKLFEPILTTEKFKLLIFGIITISVGHIMIDYLNEVRSINNKLTKSRFSFLLIFVPSMMILGGLLSLSQNASNVIILGLILLITVFLKGVVRFASLIQNEWNKEYVMWMKLIFGILFTALEVSEIVALTLFFASLGRIAMILNYQVIGVTFIIASIGGFTLNLLPDKWLLAPFKLRSITRNLFLKLQKQQGEMPKHPQKTRRRK